MAVIIYSESFDGKFKKLNFELASYGFAIAQMLNTELVSITIGDISTEELQKLGTYGVKKAIYAKDASLAGFSAQAYSAAVEAASKQLGADVIILSNNPNGKAIAPRLAVRIDGSLAAGVTDLPESVQPFVVCKRAYSGKAFAHTTLNKPVKLLTLNQNSYKLAENPTAVEIAELNFSANSEMTKGKPTETVKNSGKLSLSDADVIVSAGRGLKGSENWGMIEEMANILGAATACSRPVADLGWRPHHEHVGQTGKVIAPDLYIAIGISGAVQHLAGVNSSKVMVAINTDADAPFFEAATYGIVGDAFEVVPKLNAALKAFKESN